jgi:CTP synthase (UTP-ammonia lyase)
MKSASPWSASTPSTRTLTSSIYEAIDHAGIRHQTQVRVARIQSETIEQEGPERLWSGYDGILVPGGFGERGIEGKIEAIRYCAGTPHSVLRHLAWDAMRGH